MKKPRTSLTLQSRDERSRIVPSASLLAELRNAHGTMVGGVVINISATGALLELDGTFEIGTPVTVVLLIDGQEMSRTNATVARVEASELHRLAVVFASRLSFESLERVLCPQPYVRGELVQMPQQCDGPAPQLRYITDFYRLSSPDLFAKCRAFHSMASGLQKARMYQALYRVTLTTGLDHRAVVFNPMTRREEVMACFDSNSYLGLHLHPKVVSASREVLDRVGYGTPSAQVLGGTNRYLRELEATLCEFHGRQDAIVFPSGYAANHGLLTALLREKDLVVRDQFSHASIHDGSAMSLVGRQRVFPHADMAALDAILTKEAKDPALEGKLIATDGVFSMHGAVADLPGLVQIARRHDARLLVDEAHATGIFGPTGHGLEELFGMPGSIDLLMGTFSKTPGTIGGYVCGSEDVVTYLRFFARSGLFSAALPAHLCAGVSVAFRVMQEESEHRERLWENIRKLHVMLRDAYLPVPTTPSPIITVFSGAMPMLWSLAMDLFSANVKVGTVDYPAVGKGDTVLRITVSARHTQEDLDQLTNALVATYGRHGLIGKTNEEIRAIGCDLGQ